MQTTLFNGKQVIEQRIVLYNRLQEIQQHFASRFHIDPLSRFILNSVTSMYKLETFVLATTLLRYSDATKINLEAWVNGQDQDIIQSKTKNIISIPSLFPTKLQSPITVHPNIILFSDSYDKISYSLQQAIPSLVYNSIPNSRKITHVFRFLRSSFYFINGYSQTTISKVLGHKNYESSESYLHSSLINSYRSFLRKR